VELYLHSPVRLHAVAHRAKLLYAVALSIRAIPDQPISPVAGIQYSGCQLRVTNGSCLAGGKNTSATKACKFNARGQEPAISV